MGVFRILKRVIARLGLFLMGIILVVFFGFTLYMATLLFWHTTYWFVAVFLILILLSNLLADLTTKYLDI